jgi:hypothetical protein
MDGLGRPDDLDAVDAPPMGGGIVVEQPEDVPCGGDGVDGTDELERLARDPARADEQEPRQGVTPSRASRASSCDWRSSGSAVWTATGLVIAAKGTSRRPSMVATTSRLAARFWRASSPEPA